MPPVASKASVLKPPSPGPERAARGGEPRPSPFSMLLAENGQSSSPPASAAPRDDRLRTRSAEPTPRAEGAHQIGRPIPHPRRRTEGTIHNHRALAGEHRTQGDRGNRRQAGVRKFHCSGAGHHRGNAGSHRHHDHCGTADAADARAIRRRCRGASEALPPPPSRSADAAHSKPQSPKPRFEVRPQFANRTEIQQNSPPHPRLRKVLPPLPLLCLLLRRPTLRFLSHRPPRLRRPLMQLLPHLPPLPHRPLAQLLPHLPPLLRRPLLRLLLRRQLAQLLAHLPPMLRGPFQQLRRSRLRCSAGNCCRVCRRCFAGHSRHTRKSGRPCHPCGPCHRRNTRHAATPATIRPRQHLQKSKLPRSNSRAHYRRCTGIRPQEPQNAGERRA